MARQDAGGALGTDLLAHALHMVMPFMLQMTQMKVPHSLHG